MVSHDGKSYSLVEYNMEMSKPQSSAHSCYHVQNAQTLLQNIQS